MGSVRASENRQPHALRFADSSPHLTYETELEINEKEWRANVNYEAEKVGKLCSGKGLETPMTSSEMNNDQKYNHH